MTLKSLKQFSFKGKNQFSSINTFKVSGTSETLLHYCYYLRLLLVDQQLIAGMHPQTTKFSIVVREIISVIQRLNLIVCKRSNFKLSDLLQCIRDGLT